jgi:hypothetical protein
MLRLLLAALLISGSLCLHSSTSPSIVDYVNNGDESRIISQFGELVKEADWTRFTGALFIPNNDVSGCGVAVSPRLHPG